MALGIVSSLIATLLLAAASLVWRNRHNLSLLGTGLSSRSIVRVSCAALLRVKEDDRYVLIELSSRPTFFGPPGGVFKYRPDATDDLDAVGFREERYRRRHDEMVRDVRGFVPARSLVRFVRWFVSGAGRESAAECLRRELSEELQGHLDRRTSVDVTQARFRHLRTVTEGPARVPGQSLRLLRRLEVFDLGVDDEASARVRHHLVTLGRDPAAVAFLCATSSEIMAGWCGRSPIAPHAGYLLGGKRLQVDLPPMPDHG